MDISTLTCTEPVAVVVQLAYPERIYSGPALNLQWTYGEPTLTYTSTVVHCSEYLALKLMQYACRLHAGK